MSHPFSFFKPKGVSFFFEKKEKGLGVIEPLTAGVLAALFIGVSITVFVWGEPFLRKSEAVSVLENSETFMSKLSGQIKDVVNSQTGNRISVQIPRSPSPAIKIGMSFDGKILSLEVTGTSGTIYSTSGLVPLGRNACSPDEGSVTDVPQTICVRSDKVGDNYITTYTLKFIQLNAEGITSNKIELTGASKSGSDSIVLENKGTKTESIGGREVKKFIVAVDV